MQNKYEEWEKAHTQKMNSQFSTQGFRKTWNYFLEIAQSDYFQNFINRTRKQYKIPKNGFSNKKSWRLPPTQINEANNIVIHREIDRICKKYHLHRLDFSEIIELYLFYDILEPVHHDNVYNMCMVADLYEEWIEPFSKETQEDDNKCYPVGIRLSPYTTKRDILDFVEKTFTTHIKPLLDHYKKDDVMIGKVKSKPKKERNQFIYENRQTNKAELARLANDKFQGESLIYSDIENIIQQEIKRRKKL